MRMKKIVLSFFLKKINYRMLFDELVNVMNDKFDNQIERCKMGLQVNLIFFWNLFK